MALVVENGNGLAEAESYLTTEEADAYHAKRGNAEWAGASADAKEAALLKATAYIDANYRFKGARATGGQALEFPRIGCVDWSGYPAVGVPGRVKHACAEAALRALSVDLLADVERGGRVRSEAVGPIKTEYFDDAPAQTVFAAVDRVLAPYLKTESDPVPSFQAPSAASAFDLGGMNYLGEDREEV